MGVSTDQYGDKKNISKRKWWSLLSSKKRQEELFAHPKSLSLEIKREMFHDELERICSIKMPIANQAQVSRSMGILNLE
jgi:hypothetical protein